MNFLSVQRALAVLALGGLVAGCQSISDSPVLKSVSSAVTSAQNGFNDIQLVIAPEVAAVATVENFEVFKGLGLRNSQAFKLSGLVKTDRDCSNALMLTFSVLSKTDVVLLSPTAMVRSYVKGTKAKFEALAPVEANLGLSDGVIKQITLGKLTCS